MKVKLTGFNRPCPPSCQQRALTLDDMFKMYSPEGLGGTLQLGSIKDVPSRTNSVIVDMMGAYWIKCNTKTCSSKVWLLLILNPATQFVAIEILQDQTTASIVAALVRHMARNGPKNIFLSDHGSNFWPLGTRFGTIPDKEINNLPPMWKR